MFLHFLNIFFHLTHILIISFILTGWAFKRTRLIHLILVIATIFSWIGLGYFYGWGYCFWTDWHWQVRDLLELPHPASYIKLLVDSVTRHSWNAVVIDQVTLVVFVIVLLITVFVNLRQRFKTPY